VRGPCLKCPQLLLGSPLRYPHSKPAAAGIQNGPQSCGFRTGIRLNGGQEQFLDCTSGVTTSRVVVVVGGNSVADHKPDRMHASGRRFVTTTPRSNGAGC